MVEAIKPAIFMDGNISRKVFEKINREDIKMRPGYYFVLRCIFWRISIVLLLLLAAFSVNLLLLSLQRNLNDYSLVFFVLAFVFAIGSAKAYRRSKFCCKVSNFWLVAIILLVAIVIGSYVHKVGWGNELVAQVKHAIERAR